MMKFGPGKIEIDSGKVVVVQDVAQETSSKLGCDESMDNINDDTRDSTLATRPAKIRRVESDFLQKFNHFLKTGAVPAIVHSTSESSRQNFQNDEKPFEFRKPELPKRALKP